MVLIQVGCAGWDYHDWDGPFYPKNLEKPQHLNYYSKFFDIVEINSTFYNLPSLETVEKWYERVPENFRFFVKVWQDITHKLTDQAAMDRLVQFFYRMEPLKRKILGFLFQFPPWFKYSESHDKILELLYNEIPSNEDFIYIFELRDNSWFKPKIVEKFVDKSQWILGTTYKPGMRPHYLPNQKRYFIRLIGDRELTVFDRIQREQKEAMNHLRTNVRNLLKKSDIYEIFIIVNNHFAGFAPEVANQIKMMFDLPLKQFDKQKSMFDFI